MIGKTNSLVIQSGGGGDEPITILLPSAFANASNIYYFQVSNDKFLVSADVSNIGIWVYDKSNNSMTQKYNAGRGWQYFQQVDNDCLIGSGNTYGLLRYNGDNNTITQIYSSDYRNSFYNVGNGKYFISCIYSGYLLEYNSSTKEVSEVSIPSGNGNNYSFCQVTENKLLIGNNGSMKNVLLYNIQNDTFSSIYIDNNSYWGSITKMGNKALIVKTGGGNGVAVYDSATDTATYVYENFGYSPAGTFMVGNDCLVGSSQSSYPGIYLYKDSSDTFEQIYSSYYTWSSFKQIGTSVLVCGGTYSRGLILVDISNNYATSVAYSSEQWSSFLEIGENLLIYHNSSGATGFLLFDSSTETTTKVYSGNIWYPEFIKIDENKCLVHSTRNYAPIVLYNNLDKTVTQKYSSDYRYIAQKVGNDCLFGGDSNCNGIVLYNSLTDNASIIYSSGYGYDAFTLDGDNCYIESNIVKGTHQKLYYDSTTKTISLVGWKL